MPENKLRLPHVSFGVKGRPVMVFVAGFPDDEISGWGNMIYKFSETHRLICLCWPGYQRGGAASLPRFGYNVLEVIEAMHETLADISTEENIDNFTLVCHDWGSYLSLLYQNKYPERVSSVVCFDVGVLKKPPLKDMVVILFYQLWFCFSYIVACFLGRWTGQALLFFFFIILNPLVGPSPYDKVNRPPMDISVFMCYPYWQFHFGSMGYFRIGPKNMPRPQYPVGGCKILFMYGLKKRCMFHGPEFLAKIDKDEGSSWKAYDCGHWVQTSKFQEDVILEMRSFMERQKR